MLSENQHIELKSQLNDDVDLEKEVIAFLNTREGGKIYIGIDKSGSVIGVKNIDKLMLQNSSKQKYRLTSKGKKLQEQLRTKSQSNERF